MNGYQKIKNYISSEPLINNEVTTELLDFIDGVIVEESQSPSPDVVGDKYKLLPDGVPCDHPGCLHHISHPCEGCGRIGGKRV